MATCRQVALGAPRMRFPGKRPARLGDDSPVDTRVFEVLKLNRRWGAKKCLATVEVHTGVFRIKEGVRADDGSVLGNAVCYECPPECVIHPTTAFHYAQGAKSFGTAGCCLAVADGAPDAADAAALAVAEAPFLMGVNGQRAMAGRDPPTTA